MIAHDIWSGQTSERVLTIINHHQLSLTIIRRLTFKAFCFVALSLTLPLLLLMLPCTPDGNENIHKDLKSKAIVLQVRDNMKCSNSKLSGKRVHMSRHDDDLNFFLSLWS